MFKKLSKNQKIVLSLVLVAVIGAGIFAFLTGGEKIVGHMHMTSGGGFRGQMVELVKGEFDSDITLFDSGSGDLRAYLTVALAQEEIDRGTIFTYNHLEVHQQLEEARPLIAEFPNRYEVREEFAPLVDPLGELHLVWVDAYVIVYNPSLIDSKDVPKTWEELANFNQPISLPAKGCMGTWGTKAFFSYLGEENFAKLINNAKVAGSAGEAVEAVINGDVAVGIGSFINTDLRDNKVSIIWPEDGAIAKPSFLVLPNNAEAHHKKMADTLMSPEAAKMYASEFNLSPALAGSAVPQIVTDNNFNFIFIPSEDIICRKSDTLVSNILGN